MEPVSRSLKTLKNILFFCIVWVIIVATFGELLKRLEGSTAMILSALIAAIAAAVKWFSWKRGLTAEERTWKGYFWLYLPWAVSVVLPAAFFAAWFVWFAPPDPATTAWDEVRRWAPLFLEAIVPVLALAVAYVMVVGIEKRLGRAGLECREGDDGWNRREESAKSENSTDSSKGS